MYCSDCGGEWPIWCTCRRVNEEWIDVTKELPPSDGNYEVTNFKENPFDIGGAYYDGIGFCKESGAYCEPKYWKKTEISEKRYGKLNG